MINILAIQSRPKWSSWAKLAADTKKDWKKTLGVVFLAQTSLEYFSQHIFGCFLALTALLGYAAYWTGKRHKHAEDQEKRRIAAQMFGYVPSRVPAWAMKKVPQQPHMSDLEFERWTIFVVTLLFFGFALVFTFVTVPPNVQARFTVVGEFIKQLF